MHGAWCANVAVNEADLVLALGVRFDDRVIGDPNAFAGTATIVHIDIDGRDLGKNKPVQLQICADLRVALAKLEQLAKPLSTDAWRAYLATAARQRPLRAESSDGLTGPHAISALSEILPEEAILTTGVGQHQMWAMQFIKPRKARGFLSSSGFGTMGFGLPATIGAKHAFPEATVVNIDGDGSLNMTINELSTCHRHGIGVKIFIVNNQWLGMVRQWQDMIYAGNRVASANYAPLHRTACPRLPLSGFPIDRTRLPYARRAGNVRRRSERRLVAHARRSQ
jgi:acetolactate synthase-1/2/3 large subunit